MSHIRLLTYCDVFPGSGSGGGCDGDDGDGGGNSVMMMMMCDDSSSLYPIFNDSTKNKK